VSTAILRTVQGWYVQTGSGAAPIATSAVTTAELLTHPEAIATAAADAHTEPVESLEVLSPVTTPCRVVAQMTNYASHARDAGFSPAAVPLTFFRKASGSINGPYDDIVKPAHVRLLDYEVEIGLVIGRTIPVGTDLDETNLAEYIAGLVVANDVSARDVQLPKTQFYEAKSYPTFTPVGPVLALLDTDELKRFSDLRLRLTVNGEVRQDSIAGADIIYPPLQALQTLTRFQHLDVGDLVLTGTPAGTALSAPPKPIQLVASLLPPGLRWNLFFTSQSRNRKYLREGDVVESMIATDDGAIDLGAQRARVRYQP
jgi:2-keto-4-pentenoate hydratase/2-oxohepta-3-ene-1,7-dioic acid hydratase in catechol pathway